MRPMSLAHPHARTPGALYRLLVVAVLGFASGRIAQIPTNRPLIKGFSVVGVRAGEYGPGFP